MKATTQRRKAHRKLADPCVVHIETKDGMGKSRWVTADLVDVMGSGCGLALMTVLKSGSSVVVRGRLGENRGADHRKAWVRWCVGRTDGTFRAGLEFLESRSTTNLDEEKANSANPDTLDFYEVMQLSPNADADTISRVYRMLAFRYHPDNKETGNSEMFIQLSAAHQILSDSEKRANYDVRRQTATRIREKNPNQVPAVTGNEWVKQRTIDIVTAAYSGVISLERTQARVCWEG